MMKSDLKKVVSYLKTQRLMALATYGEKPWIAWVFFAVDEKLNLYFLSDPTTQHCLDIAKNDLVSCGVAVSDQPFKSNKIGVQISGRVEKPSKSESLIMAAKLLVDAVPGFAKYLNVKDIKTLRRGNLFKIKPTTIRFYNEELYPKEKCKLFEI